jgi:hypothetical protein
MRDHKQAHALAGEWYSWLVADHEAEPGKPEKWDIAFSHLVDEMVEALPADVVSEEMARNKHVLTDWAAYPEVRDANPTHLDLLRYELSRSSRRAADLGRQSQPWA